MVNLSVCLTTACWFLMVKCRIFFICGKKKTWLTCFEVSISRSQWHRHTQWLSLGSLSQFPI